MRVSGIWQFRLTLTHLASRRKAPEDWRTPRRWRASPRFSRARSVLDCGGPPPLFHRTFRNCAKIKLNCYICGIMRAGLKKKRGSVSASFSSSSSKGPKKSEDERDDEEDGPNLIFRRALWRKAGKTPSVTKPEVRGMKIGRAHV